MENTFYTYTNTFLTNILQMLASLVTSITGNEVLTVLTIGITLISFATGLLGRLIRRVFR